MTGAGAANTEFESCFVVDPYFKNMPALGMEIPRGWRASSALKWALGDIVDVSDFDFPVNVWVRVEDPATGSAYEQFPTINFSYVPGAMPMGMPSLPSLGGMLSGLFGGKRPAAAAPPAPAGPPRMTGAIKAIPGSAVDAIVKFLLPRYRTLPDLRVTGTIMPPELVEQAKQLAQPNVPTEPAGVRVEYTIAGRAFEEEITGVLRRWEVPSTGPMGTIVQTNWHLYGPVGMRAPAGTLASVRPLMTRAMGLNRINPEWIKLRDQVTMQIQQQANALWQQGYDQIAAAGAMSRQIHANSEAFLQSFEAHRQQANAEWNQNRAAAQAAGNARSATAGFDDYIRGVNTYEDPYWGQSQHSIDHDYAWTDGSGNYKYSNDASFDPNIGATQSWQLMKKV